MEGKSGEGEQESTEKPFWLSPVAGAAMYVCNPLVQQRSAGMQCMQTLPMKQRLWSTGTTAAEGSICQARAE